jgi:hypothetical protein
MCHLLAAMSPESASYEDWFAVIRRLNLPYEDSPQQYLQIVFNIVARNVDISLLPTPSCEMILGDLTSRHAKKSESLSGK